MSKVRHGAMVALTSMLWAVSYPASSAPQPACVKVFDALRYTGKPDLAPYGMEKISVPLARQWWGKGESLHEFTRTDSPEKWVRSLQSSTRMVAVDLEHWETRGAADIAEPNVRRLVSVVERLRAGGLKNPVGFYGILPNRDYWSAMEEPSSGKYKSWQRDNDYVVPLAAVVDVLFPSLYTFYDDPVRWKVYARENISEAKRLAKGKPVYPFVWPQYHDGTVLEGQYIPAAEWRSQLDLLAAEADGIVIWGGWAKEEGRLKWDEAAEWWGETKRFLEQVRDRCRDLETPRAPGQLEVLVR